tara:strand:+ start:8357 stop:9007 length:651 start_codon:yes stop_codon:yes gene_type:complete
MQGTFITFESGEGAGKTTQARLLKSYLDRRGYPNFLNREPGGSKAAEMIRRLLLHEEFDELDSISELLLFGAARADNTARVVRPHLEKGEVVIYDRYFDSTDVYQGRVRGIDVKTTRFLNNLATRGLSPDLTILIDVPPEHEETVLRRAIGESGSADRIEAENLEFHRKVYQGYRAQAADYPDRIKVFPYIPNGQEETHQRILEYVTPLIQHLKPA